MASKDKKGLTEGESAMEGLNQTTMKLHQLITTKSDTQLLEKKTYKLISEMYCDFVCLKLVVLVIFRLNSNI